MTAIRLIGLALLGGAATVATSQEESLSVCVGADHVLREREGTSCPRGARTFELALEQGKIEPAEGDENEAALRSQVDDLRRKLDVMSTRVQDLQRALADASPSPAGGNPDASRTRGGGNVDASRTRSGGKVVLPFEIVNARGATVLKVEANPDGGATLVMSNGSGAPVLWASALNSGGFFKTRGPAVFPELVMGTSGSYGGFAIRDGEQKVRLSMSLAGGKPSIELTNDSHVGMVSISQGSSGGGQLELGDAAGNGMVRAGITAGGCGRVETYPERPVRATALGVPGDKILGNCK